jgi:hypothetical protein
MSSRLRFLVFGFALFLSGLRFPPSGFAVTTAEDFRLNSSTHRPINSALDLSTTTTTFADAQIPQAKINGLTTSLATEASTRAAADTAEATARAAAVTAEASTRAAADTAAAAALASHTGDTSNPHSVTKAQVGLGNADNTSDTNKPVSTAQQTALDGKQPVDSDLTAIAALSTTAYGRALLALADGTAAITAFGKTTLAGYGITDAQPIDSDLTAIAALSTTSFGRSLLALADGTAAITAFGKTTLAGYGITDLVAKTDTANTFVPLQTFNSFASYSVNATQLSNPGAPAITNVGTPGATTWTYKIVAVLADGSTTAAGTAGSTATGNATLDATNKNSLTWTAVTGASTYDVYRTVAGLVPSTIGKLANVSSPAYIDAGAAGNLSLPPSTNSTGSITAANATLTGNAVIAGSSSSATSSTSGNATVGGNSAITGNETVGGTSAVTGNSTVGGTFTATGIATAPLRDKGGQVYNADAYGCIGDGTTDNSAAIAAMFSTASSASNPVFRFGKGTYITTGVTPPAHSMIEGAGQAITTIKVKSGSSLSEVFYFTSDNITIRDLTLDGNHGNVTQTGLNGANALIFISGSYALIERVEITHGEFSGLYIGDVSHVPVGVVVNDCWIHDNGGTVATGNGVGITAGGTVLPSGLFITNNVIENNHNTVTRPNDSGALNLVVNSATISGNYFKNNYNVGGGQIGTNGPTTISDNIFELTGTFGSPADSTAGIEIVGVDCTVTGNVILGYTGGSGINIDDGGGHSTITGNKIKGGPNGASGIVLFGNQTGAVSDVAVNGNQVEATNGIVLNSATTNVTISGNELHRCTNGYAFVGGGSLSTTVTGDIIPQPWTAYTPTVTSGTGTIASYTATGRYRKISTSVQIEIIINIVTNGSAGTVITATLPFQCAGSSFALSGREDALNNYALNAFLPAFQSVVNIAKYDNSYLGGNGAKLVVSGIYETLP